MKRNDIPTSDSGSRTVPVMECRRSRCSAVVYREKIYMFGGCGIPDKFSGGRLKGDICCFDIKRREWSRLACGGGSFPPPRMHHICFIKDNKLVIHGGIDSSGNHLDDMWAVSLRNQTSHEWRRVAIHSTNPLPTLACHAGVVVSDLYIHGGLLPTPSPTLFKFTFCTQNWSQIQSTNCGPLLHDHTIEEYSGQLFAYSGLTYHQGCHTALNTQLFCYTISSKIWRPISFQLRGSKASIDDFTTTPLLMSIISSTKAVWFWGTTGVYFGTLPPPKENAVVFHLYGKPSLMPERRIHGVTATYKRNIWLMFGEQLTKENTNNSISQSVMKLLSEGYDTSRKIYTDVNVYTIDTNLWADGIPFGTTESELSSTLQSTKEFKKPTSPIIRQRIAPPRRIASKSRISVLTHLLREKHEFDRVRSDLSTQNVLLGEVNEYGVMLERTIDKYLSSSTNSRCPESKKRKELRAARSAAKRNGTLYQNKWSGDSSPPAPKTRIVSPWEQSWSAEESSRINIDIVAMEDVMIPMSDLPIEQNHNFISNEIVEEDCDQQQLNSSEQQSVMLPENNQKELLANKLSEIDIKSPLATPSDNDLPEHSGQRVTETVSKTEEPIEIKKPDDIGSLSLSSSTQRHYRREYYRDQLNKTDKQRVIRLQSFQRGRIARKEVSILKQQREDAAIKIQTADQKDTKRVMFMEEVTILDSPVNYKPCLPYLRLLVDTCIYHSKTPYLYKVTRLGLAREEHSSHLLLSWFTGLLSCEELQKYERLVTIAEIAQTHHEAAKLIQKWYFRCQDRKSRFNKINKHRTRVPLSPSALPRRHQAAALRIQCSYRCYKASNERRELSAAQSKKTTSQYEDEQAAIAIQCSYRCHKAHRAVSQRRETKQQQLVEDQSAAEQQERETFKTEQSAATIQRAFRYKHAQSNISSLQRERDRLFMEEETAAEEQEKLFLAEEQHSEQAASSIQRAYRYSKAHSNSCSLQLDKECQRLKEEQIAVEQEKLYLEQHPELLREEYAAGTIQRAFRYNKARTSCTSRQQQTARERLDEEQAADEQERLFIELQKEADAERHVTEDKASQKIQQAFRMKTARKRSQTARDELSVQREAESRLADEQEKLLLQTEAASPALESAHHQKEIKSAPEDKENSSSVDEEKAAQKIQVAFRSMSARQSISDMQRKRSLHQQEEEMAAELQERQFLSTNGDDANQTHPKTSDGVSEPFPSNTAEETTTAEQVFLKGEDNAAVVIQLAFKRKKSNNASKSLTASRRDTRLKDELLAEQQEVKYLLALEEDRNKAAVKIQTASRSKHARNAYQEALTARRKLREGDELLAARQETNFSAAQVIQLAYRSRLAKRSTSPAVTISKEKHCGMFVII